jgi:hypothetical protein
MGARSVTASPVKERPSWRLKPPHDQQTQGIVVSGVVQGSVGVTGAFDVSGFARIAIAAPARTRSARRRSARATTSRACSPR